MTATAPEVLRVLQDEPVDLPAAMRRYDRARRLSQVDGAADEAAVELASARVALVALLAADGWVPELRVSSQVERDMAMLRTRDTEVAEPPTTEHPPL